MTAERALVFLLAVVSTLATGLAVDLRGRVAVATGDVAPARAALTPAVLALLVVANVALLPAALWTAARLSSLSLSSGVLLAAAAPGGSTGPLLALVAGGDAATTARGFVALTLAGTVAALVATLFVDAGGLVQVGAAAALVVVSSIGPLVAGVVIVARWPARARVLQPWLARGALALLVATVVVLAARHGAEARALDLAIGALATVLALAIGLVVDGAAARVALAQLSAVRNLTLALVVLAATDAAPAATLAALSYGLGMYGVALVAAVVARAAIKRP